MLLRAWAQEEAGVGAMMTVSGSYLQPSLGILLLWTFQDTQTNINCKEQQMPSGSAAKWGKIVTEREVEPYL